MISAYYIFNYYKIITNMMVNCDKTLAFNIQYIAYIGYNFYIGEIVSSSGQERNQVSIQGNMHDNYAGKFSSRGRLTSHTESDSVIISILGVLVH